MLEKENYKTIYMMNYKLLILNPLMIQIKYASVYNHASINIKSNKGFKLLSDHWVYGPIYGGSMCNFLYEIKTKEYYSQDAIYITPIQSLLLKYFKKIFKINTYLYTKYDKSVPLKK